MTIFPIQYDLTRGEYIYHRKLDLEVLSHPDEEGENEIYLPLPRVTNLWTRKFIREIAVNADQYLRDIPEEEPPLPGHYLIVAHQNALLWHLPFSEWRRKMGYKVDVYSVPSNQAGNPEAIRDEIRNRYNAYRQNGQEPFDHILIIGDRTTYDNRTPAPQHIITPFTGSSIWGSGGPHADYAFGLLEGNDNWPDVAVSRFPSGSQSVANLIVNRTLAYISTPRMQNPEWFLRGAVYSQHWGNSATSAWHVTIPTNVRWAEEILKNLGFNDVAFYENYQWDRMGDAIGPFLRDQLNRGVNLLLGRAENYYWRDNFQGVNNNTVFPIKICLSGHGEWTAYNMFRTGDGNNLKGPVAMTFGWGGPPTAPNSYMWLEMVNSTLNKDFTLGWARTLAITKIERYFPNINVGRNLYDHVKTDVDMFGDPAIQPWIGIPTQVNVTYPSTITLNTKSVIITVRDQRGSPVAGTLATLYAPGRIPTNDPAQYANWRNITQINLLTDSEGVARFILPSNFQFEANTRVYLTVSGRKIRPWNVELTVSTPLQWIDISVPESEEIEGNGDEAFNPGEVWRIFPVARNLGNRNAVENLWAEVFSNSPYLALSRDTLNFGTINPGESRRSEESITVEILNGAPDSYHHPSTTPTIDLVFHSEDETWRSAFSIPISSFSLELNHIIGGTVIGYNAQNITLELINRGSTSSPALNVQLRPLEMGINVINSRTTYPTIAPGRTARPNGNTLTVVANRLAVPGSLT
ncbi:MAG: C25 family cysteine peptidase, partial [bacterium]